MLGQSQRLQPSKGLGPAMWRPHCHRCLRRYSGGARWQHGGGGGCHGHAHRRRQGMVEKTRYRHLGHRCPPETIELGDVTPKRSRWPSSHRPPTAKLLIVIIACCDSKLLFHPILPTTAMTSPLFVHKKKRVWPRFQSQEAIFLARKTKKKSRIFLTEIRTRRHATT